jgi:hypothetical protein
MSGIINMFPGGGGGAAPVAITNATLPGSVEPITQTIGDAGELFFLQFIKQGGMQEIYSPDEGATWYHIQTGNAITFPLVVANGIVSGSYAYYSTIVSIAGRTVTYRSYREHTSSYEASANNQQYSAILL